MPGPARNIDCLTGFQIKGFMVPGDLGVALNNEPVLSALSMSLETEPLARVDNNPFDFVVGLVLQHHVIPPRSMILTMALRQDLLVNTKVIQDHPLGTEPLSVGILADGGDIVELRAAVGVTGGLLSDSKVMLVFQY